MFDIPLIITRPEIKAIADRLTKKTGSKVTPANVMYALALILARHLSPNPNPILKSH
jgi:hypothetical protein